MGTQGRALKAPRGWWKCWCVPATGHLGGHTDSGNANLTSARPFSHQCRLHISGPCLFRRVLRGLFQAPRQACLAPPHALDFSGMDTDAVHQTACCQLQTPAGNMDVSLRKLPHTPQVHLLHHLISRPSSNTGQLLRASPHPRVKVT